MQYCCWFSGIEQSDCKPYGHSSYSLHWLLQIEIHTYQLCQYHLYNFQVINGNFKLHLRSIGSRSSPKNGPTTCVLNKHGAFWYTFIFENLSLYRYSALIISITEEETELPRVLAIYQSHRISGIDLKPEIIYVKRKEKNHGSWILNNRG